ncbi:MAG: hypothetical protein WCG01_01420 [bacterium]
MKYLPIIPAAFIISTLLTIIVSNPLWQMFWLLLIAAALMVYVKTPEWIKENIARTMLYVTVIAITNLAFGHIIGGWFKHNFPTTYQMLPSAKQGTDLSISRIIKSPNAAPISILDLQKMDLANELAKKIDGKSVAEQKELVDNYVKAIEELDRLEARLEQKKAKVIKSPSLPNFRKVQTTAYYTGKIKLPPNGASPWYHCELGTKAYWTDDGDFIVRYKDGIETAPSTIRNSALPFQFINRGDSPLEIKTRVVSI